MSKFLDILILYIFPILVLLLCLLWGLCLYRFLSAKMKNKKEPGSLSDADIKKRKVWLIVVSVILGALALISIGFFPGILFILIFYLFIYIFPILVPLLCLLWGLCLYRFLSAKKKNKKEPGRFSEEEIKNRKVWLIVVSVILGVLALISIGFIILLNMAVAYM